jgi:hypothetical protein
MITACRACGRSIFFGITPAGKKIPLNAKPITAFVVEPDSLVSGAPLAKTVSVYTTHFADCPSAEQFRNSKPKGQSDENKG